MTTYVPGGSNWTGWPTYSPTQNELWKRRMSAEAALISASTEAARSLFNESGSAPPLALLALWRSAGLEIKRLDNELRAAESAWEKGRHA